MAVYIQEQVLFSNIDEVANFVVSLPPFALSQVNKIVASKNKFIYQVIVYCFDDEVDVSSILIEMR